MNRPAPETDVTARLAAHRLAPRFGPRIVVAVDDALDVAGGRTHPDRYVEPIALAALIVSATQLTWTVYHDLRTRRAERKHLADSVRAELPDHPRIKDSDRDAIVDVVVNTIVETIASQATGKSDTQH